MIAESSVLIVVDVQNDFCPGGSLAVPGGNEIVPLINRLARRFTHVVLTQDWHPAGHASFASSHPGQKPFDVVSMPYGRQMLWPDHCVQGTRGAAFHPALDIPRAETIIRKGFRSGVDSYSAFLEADRSTPTGLAGYLRERRIEQTFIVGLALDFCVAWTALDARGHGFETTVVDDACRAINAPTAAGGTLAQAWSEMVAAGVTRIRGDSLA